MKKNSQLNKEVILFNESFNNISLIEQLEKVDGLNDAKNDSLINLSINIEEDKIDEDGPIIENLKSPFKQTNYPNDNTNNASAYKANAHNINAYNANNYNANAHNANTHNVNSYNVNNDLGNKRFNNFIKAHPNNEVLDPNNMHELKNLKTLKDLIKDINIDSDREMIKEIEFQTAKQFFKPIQENDNDNDKNNDSIVIEDMGAKGSIRNSSKNVEGSTKLSKNDKDQPDKELEKSEENLISLQPKFSKSGTNFYPKIKSENVPDLLKRILEKNKKEASVKQRDCFNNITTQKNQNLYRNGKFLLNMERPSTQHSSKQNPSVKKSFAVENTDINFNIDLSDVYFWRKHEELWNNLNTSTFKINNDFENYFIPKYESEILNSIFFKANGIIKDKIIITEKIFNPKHEIKKWKDAYKVAIKRWHPDKLIPLLADLKIKDEIKNSYILKKCGSILNNINKSINIVLDVLKKIMNKQAPKL